MKKGKLVVGLDVGTTKICAIVGEVTPVKTFNAGFDESSTGGNGGMSLPILQGGQAGQAGRGHIDVISVGSVPSKGLRKGVVVNIESTVESIRKAVEEAEAMAGVEISAVYVGIAGGHINSFPSNGVIAVKEKEIGDSEIERVIDAARAVAIPLDREVLHVIPVGYRVDGQNGISDPRGMCGVRLEANVQIITGAVTSVQNLIKSCQKAGLEVIDIVLEPLASARATLKQEEMDLGVGLVDIGGGTTDIALFHAGSICHTAVLTLGGINFTNDIAIGLRIPASEAERVKINYGCPLTSMIKSDEMMEINSSESKSGRKMPRQHLVEIIQPRAEELFYLVKEEIIKSGFHGLMASGVVLTGGTALMNGIDVMAEKILELPVRIGRPGGIGGITDITSNPMYATGVGLVLHGAEGIIKENRFNNGNIFNAVMAKMKGWGGKILNLKL